MKLSVSKIVWTLLLLPEFLAAAVIAEKGSSDYDIVIKPEAPRVTVFAAGELTNYMKKVAGVEMKTLNAKAAGRKAIYVGSHSELPKTEEFDLAKYTGKERFRIAELPGGDIVIMGADNNFNPVSRKNADFGLLFGVYDFLEKFLGVRWYAPGEFGECFEKMDTVDISGLPVDETPAYYARGYWPWKWNEFSGNRLSGIQPPHEGIRYQRRLFQPLHDGLLFPLS